MMKTFFGGLSGAVTAICILIILLISPIFQGQWAMLLGYFLFYFSPLIILIGTVIGVSLADKQQVVETAIIRDNDILMERFKDNWNTDVY